MGEVKRNADVVCKVSDFGESRAIAISAQGRQNLANPRMHFIIIIIIIVSILHVLIILQFGWLPKS